MLVSMNTVDIIECGFTFVVAEGKLSINIINYLAAITKTEIFLPIWRRVMSLVFVVLGCLNDVDAIRRHS